MDVLAHKGTDDGDARVHGGMDACTQAWILESWVHWCIGARMRTCMPGNIDARDVWKVMQDALGALVHGCRHACLETLMLGCVEVDA